MKIMKRIALEFFTTYIISDLVLPTCFYMHVLLKCWGSNIYNEQCTTLTKAATAMKGISLPTLYYFKIPRSLTL